jgi:hypothetical protein
MNEDDLRGGRGERVDRTIPKGLLTKLSEAAEAGGDLEALHAVALEHYGRKPSKPTAQERADYERILAAVRR